MQGFIQDILLGGGRWGGSVCMKVKRKWSIHVDMLELKKMMSYSATKVKARARSTQDIPSELYDFLSN